MFWIFKLLLIVLSGFRLAKLESLGGLLIVLIRVESQGLGMWFRDVLFGFLHCCFRFLSNHESPLLTKNNKRKENKEKES